MEVDSLSLLLRYHPNSFGYYISYNYTHVEYIIIIIVNNILFTNNYVQFNYVNLV